MKGGRLTVIIFFTTAFSNIFALPPKSHFTVPYSQIQLNLLTSGRKAGKSYPTGHYAHSGLKSSHLNRHDFIGQYYYRQDKHANFSERIDHFYALDLLRAILHPYLLREGQKFLNDILSIQLQDGDKAKDYDNIYRITNGLRKKLSEVLRSRIQPACTEAIRNYLLSINSDNSTMLQKPLGAMSKAISILNPFILTKAMDNLMMTTSNQHSNTNRNNGIGSFFVPMTSQFLEYWMKGFNSGVAAKLQIGYAQNHGHQGTLNFYKEALKNPYRTNDAYIIMHRFFHQIEGLVQQVGGQGTTINADSMYFSNLLLAYLKWMTKMKDWLIEIVLGPQAFYAAFGDDMLKAVWH